LPLPNVVSPDLQLTRVAIKTACENSEVHSTRFGFSYRVA
jgi:hypothetical protein